MQDKENFLKILNKLFGQWVKVGVPRHQNLNGLFWFFGELYDIDVELETISLECNNGHASIEWNNIKEIHQCERR